MARTEVLIITEGEVGEVKLLNKFFEIFDIKKSPTIVSYGTDIYSLYYSMTKDEECLEDISILTHLRSREKDVDKKKIFNKNYSDVLLFFDMEIQAHKFSFDKIKEMVEHFNDSTNIDKGKLYINYPMLESFYHMNGIPDMSYNTYKVHKDEISKFKRNVHLMNQSHYNGLSLNREEFTIIIKQNLEKAWLIQGEDKIADIVNSAVQLEQKYILDEQLAELSSENKLNVLCTCIFFLAEEYPRQLCDLDIV
jgi:hypothetical protein